MSKKYIVVVESVPENNIEFLRIIRTVGNLSLEDAVEINRYISSNLPCPIVAGVNSEKAEHIADKISSIGGKVRINESEIVHPMVLYPNAKEIYEFNFWGIKKK